MKKVDIVTELLALNKTNAELEGLSYNELRKLLKETRPPKEVVTKKGKKKKSKPEPVKSSQAQQILHDRAMAKIEDGFVVDANSARRKGTFNKDNSEKLLGYIVKHDITSCVCMKCGRPPAVYNL